MTGPDDLELDNDKIEKEILGFVKTVVRGSGAKGAIVGLSGGIDSSVVGALCVRALGKRRVVGVLLPASHTPKTDIQDARGLADSWGIKTFEATIDGPFEAVVSSLPAGSGRVAQANVKARLRMVMLYYLANTLSMLVAGTGDRSEDSVGYFTKYGDGGADFMPISHLYKTQVRSLGTHLGLPRRIVTKPASPQLWPGHRATDEIPLDYDRLDLVLHCLLDRKMDVAKTARETGVERKVVETVLARYRSSEHKRTYPPMVRPWSSGSA